jgi:hypothetical protein
MTTRSPCLPSCRVLGVGWLRRPWVLRACADCPGAYDDSYPYNIPSLLRQRHCICRGFFFGVWIFLTVARDLLPSFLFVLLVSPRPEYFAFRGYSLLYPESLCALSFFCMWYLRFLLRKFESLFVF